MVRITRAQRVRLHERWLRLKADARAEKRPCISYRAFRRTIQPTIGCQGAIVVAWCGMWLVIETDGYSHT